MTVQRAGELQWQGEWPPSKEFWAQVTYLPLTSWLNPDNRRKRALLNAYSARSLSAWFYFTSLKSPGRRHDTLYFTRRRSSAQTSKYILKDTQLVDCKYGIQAWRLACCTASFCHISNLQEEGLPLTQPAHQPARQTRRSPVLPPPWCCLWPQRDVTSLHPLHARVMVS